MMTIQTAATTDITSALPSARQADAITLGWADLIPHRDYMVRFAARKLHDPALAEDVVHDVFEAAITGRAQFEGRASLRSWLTGVLKFKLVDLIRQRVRYDHTDGDNDGDDTCATDLIACTQPGPQDLAEQRELLTQVLKRIDALPPGLREVMLFRVLHEEPSATVCKRLGITETSLFVRLHRARKQLMC